MKNNVLKNNLLGVGLYTVAEASTYTGIASRDIKRWLFGYTTNGVEHSGLWTSLLADTGEQALGFQDLLEIRFVHAFRQHNISLQAIRSASAHARELFHQDYPFTCRRFQTDGRGIFATVHKETGEEAILDLVKRQYAFKQVIAPALYEGIDFSKDGDALCWYPLKRNKAVVLDPKRNFGKPIVTRFGVDTSTLAMAYQAERQNSNRVALLYEVPVSAVEAAVLFENRIAA